MFPLSLSENTYLNESGTVFIIIVSVFHSSHLYINIFGVHVEVFIESKSSRAPCSLPSVFGSVVASACTKELCPFHEFPVHRS